MGKEGILHMFPTALRGMFHRAAGAAESLQEIRLRAGQPVILVRNGQECFLTGEGQFTREAGAARRMAAEELEQIVQHICQYSVYAYADEIRQGYVTLPGGHRVGVAGQAVLDGENSIRTIKNIRYLNIRIAHEVKGAAKAVLPHVYERGKLRNTLILSPPGCGKTTLLRDLVREVSNGNEYGKGMSVGVADERSEIAGSCLGVAQNDLGMRTDVLDGCPKAMGMMLLIRSMSPGAIAVDELGSERDAEALERALRCGCKILATIHAEDMEDARRKSFLQELLREDAFERFIELGKEDGKCVVKNIYRNGEWHGQADRGIGSHPGEQWLRVPNRVGAEGVPCAVQEMAGALLADGE